MRYITVRRVLSSILLPAYLSSCTSWQVQSVSPEQAITEDQPSKVRVTLTDSSTVEMEQPRIVGDTLRGLVKGEHFRGTVKDEISLIERDVLLADIAVLEVRETSVGKSVLLGLGIVAGVFAGLVAALIIVCSDQACAS